jgi:hypothetical protein
MMSRRPLASHARVWLLCPHPSLTSGPVYGITNIRYGPAPSGPQTKRNSWSNAFRLVTLAHHTDIGCVVSWLHSVCTVTSHLTVSYILRERSRHNEEASLSDLTALHVRHPAARVMLWGRKVRLLTSQQDVVRVMLWGRKVRLLTDLVMLWRRSEPLLSDLTALHVRHPAARWSQCVTLCRFSTPWPQSFNAHFFTLVTQKTLYVFCFFRIS